MVGVAIARLHPARGVLAPALAVAEATGASGQSVLAAFALGLEVANAVGRALGVSRYGPEQIDFLAEVASEGIDIACKDSVSVAVSSNLHPNHRDPG